MFSRICPSCKEKVFHTSKYNRNQSDKKKRLCRRCNFSSENHRNHCKMNYELYLSKHKGSGEKNPFFGMRHSEKTKEMISLKRKGQRNSPETEFGKNGVINSRPLYDIWLEKYGEEKACEKLDALKKKQSIINSGKNNSMYGRPSPQGSGNGWSGWYKDWFFRSLRELSYMINEIELNQRLWRSAESNDLRIEYYDFNGCLRNYFADFLLEEKYLIECKPKKLFNTPIVLLKKKGADVFCEKNGFEYSLVDPGVIDTEIIRSLYRDNLIIFTKRYDIKYKELYGQDDYS